MRAQNNCFHSHVCLYTWPLQSTFLAPMEVLMLMQISQVDASFSPWNGLAVPLTILLCRTNCFFGPVKCALVIFCRLVYYLQMIKKRPLVHSSQIMCLAARGSQLPLTGVHVVSSYDVHACRNMCTWEMCCFNSPDGWLIFLFMKLIRMYVCAMWLYTSAQHAMCMDTRRGQRSTLNVIPPVLSTLFFKTGPHWSRTHQVSCAAKAAICLTFPLSGSQVDTTPASLPGILCCICDKCTCSCWCLHMYVQVSMHVCVLLYRGQKSVCFLSSSHFLRQSLSLPRAYRFS